MKTKIAFALGFILALTAAATPQKSATLVVSGYAGSTALENFPLLVRISDIPGFLYDDCAANGADVWFASDAAGANPLPHEIDAWNPAGDTCAWVKVPSISGTATTLYMFWKDSAPPANDPTDVWGEYAGVWHLGEATGSATAADATGHGLGATVADSDSTGQKPGVKAAMVGNGRWIPKTSLQVPSYDDLAVGSVFTASGWFYLDERTVQEQFFKRTEFVKDCEGWIVCMTDDRTVKSCGGGASLTASAQLTTSAVGRWVYVVAVYNNSGVTVYLPSDSKVSNTPWIVMAKDNGLPLTVGGDVKGTLDEIRIRTAASSADWIQAEYDSVNSASFVTSDLPTDSILVKGDTRLQGEKALGYGLKENLASGTIYTYTQQECATNVAETIEYVCAGWELKLKDSTVITSTEETKRTCSFTYAAAYDGATLTWKWVPSRYWLAVATVGGGTVDVASQFVTTGGVVTLTATPASGQRFWKWTSTVALDDSISASIDVTVGEPMTVTAKFYDPATAQRAKAYVVPGGAGTKDGSSWANASGSVALGYAAAADSPVGGDVYLKAGVYTVAAPIAMEPNVTVVGGVDGGETILSGDLAKPDVWVPRSNTTSCGEILQDGQIYLPDYPADETEYYRAWEVDWNATYDTPRAFVCTSKDAPNNVFTNLTMAMFHKAAICANGASADGLQVLGCRFYANNHLAGYGNYAADAGVIDIRAGMATIRDCVFRYNGFGVNLAEINDQTEERRSRVVNCRFLSNAAIEQVVSQTKSGGTTIARTGGAAGVTARNNVLVDIENCTFFRCAGSGSVKTDYDAMGGAVTIYGNGPTGLKSVISNCQFTGNFSIAQYNRAPAIRASQSGLLEVAACSFVSNFFCYHVASSSGGSGTILQSAGRLLVRDSYFANNLFTNNLCAGYATMSSVYDGGNNTATFLNCTIENNRTEIPVYDLSTQIGSSTLFSKEGSHFALVNCILKDNYGRAKDGTRLPDIGRNTVSKNSDFAIVNTVMTSADDDYLPFVSPFLNQRSTVLATSVIKNFDWGEDVSEYSYQSWAQFGCLLTPVKPTSELDPMVSATLRTKGFLSARGVDAAAPKIVRMGGTPVYRGTDDRYYLRNPNSPASESAPWWPLEDHNNRLTDAQAEALGVTTASAIAPDAFGATRKADKIAFGPLVPRPRGLALLLR